MAAREALARYACGWDYDDDFERAPLVFVQPVVDRAGRRAARAASPVQPAHPPGRQHQQDVATTQVAAATVYS